MDTTEIQTSINFYEQHMEKIYYLEKPKKFLKTPKLSRLNHEETEKKDYEICLGVYQYMNR